MNLWLVLQLGLIAESLGHQGQQAFGDRATAAHQQLKGGVEVGGITEGWIDHGLEVRSIGAPNRIEVALRCFGPVEVAQQGVDFTVVTQQAHGLRQRPPGQGVGAEAAVIHRKADRETLIAQIAVEGREHLRAHHSLVNNGATAQRAEVQVAGLGAKADASAVAATPAQAEEQRFELITFDISPQQPLFNLRGIAAGQWAEHLVIGGHHPPAKRTQAELGGRLITKRPGLGRTLRLPGQKHHAQTTGLAS